MTRIIRIIKIIKIIKLSLHENWGFLVYITESNRIVIYIVRGWLPSQRIIPNDIHCDNNNNGINDNGIYDHDNNQFFLFSLTKIERSSSIINRKRRIERLSSTTSNINQQFDLNIFFWIEVPRLINESAPRSECT